MYMGKKVKLRDVRRDELGLIKEMINDAAVKENLSPGIPYPYKEDDEEKWYESYSGLGDTYNFAIEELKEGAYIGNCGVNTVDWKNSVVEVGIFLGKEYLNRGYGTDAMKTLVKFIFEQMNINKVKLHVYSFNERARRCYEKVGFKEEGRLRQEIFRNGAYHDIICMGILRDEFLNMQKK